MPHPWTRFEAISTLALVLFILAGLGGLVAIWLGLAWSPGVVTAVHPEIAFTIFVLEASTITCSIGLALCARTIVVREWLRIAATANSAQIKSLHGFIVGAGLLSAWGSLLVPIYAAALLSMSSFASLIVVGMLYASVSGLMSGHAAAVEYRAARKTANGDGKGRFAWLPLAGAFVSLLAGVVTIAELVPVVVTTRNAIVAPIDRQIEAVRLQITYQSEDLPISERVYAERLSAETAALDSATRSLKRGIGSDREVLEARQKLLQAQAESIRVIGEARQALSRLKREEAELTVRRTHAESAAPALPGTR